MENINLRFVDSTKSFYRIHPIQRAASVDPAHKDFQVKQHGRETFVDCPGMFDYKNTGWILTAWDEFTVYASKNATMAYAGNDNKRPGGSLPTPIKDGCPHMTAPNLMSADITDGIPNGADNSVNRLQPLHFTSPWAVEPENKDTTLSLLLMPPIYHSNIVDNFLIFPGIVDYTQKFGTINVIMSPRKEGTFVIKAGTPLLHIIPMKKANYNLKYGPQKRESLGALATAKQFYRKYVMKRSKYTVEQYD